MENIFTGFSPFVIASTVLFGLAGGLGIDFFIRVWDGFTARYLGELSAMCHMLYIDDKNFQFWLRLWGLALLAIFLGLGIVGGMWPITVAVMFLVYMVPRLFLMYLIKKRKLQFRDQLVSAMNILSNSVKAGLSPEKAIQIAAGEIPDPLSREFGRISREYNQGRSFLDALQAAKERLDLQSFTLFVSALTAFHDRGGNVTDVLARLRKSLIENQRLERKLEAETASGNLVILILSLFPYGFLLLSLMINYDSTLLFFNTWTGQILFSLILLITYVGYRWGRKIMNIDF